MDNNQLWLKSERLTLRPWCDADLPALFECFSDPEAMKYWSSAPHKSIEETKERLEIFCAKPGTIELVIVFNSSVVGRCCFCDSEIGHEIGYILNRKHWGQGIATEAMRTLLKHIFSMNDDPNFTIAADA